MPQVLAAAGAPKTLGDVGRDGNSGSTELSRKSISFYIRKLTSESIRLDY